jgi:hypothetical protein
MTLVDLIQGIYIQKQKWILLIVRAVQKAL